MDGDAQDLSAPLTAAHKDPPPKRASVVGMVLVTVSALLFGVVAALIKACALPTLVMLQVRSVLECLLVVVVAIAYVQMQPEAQTESALVPKPKTNGPGGGLKMLLIGPPHLRGWLVLRAFLYWAFLTCWWLALTSMPIGDATTIVYTGPVWTALFSRMFLKEGIDWHVFLPIVALDACGVLLITQPSFLFPSAAHGGAHGVDESSYMLGTLSALFAAVVGGLFPVCTRKSKECFWTAVNNTSSVLSALVFTPVAFFVWFSVDDTALDRTLSSVGRLEGGDGSMSKWALLVGATLTGFGALAMNTIGYQKEEATKASMMTILEIPFAYLLQGVVFNDAVTPLGLLGVGLICVGSLINLLNRMRQAAPSENK